MSLLSILTFIFGTIFVIGLIIFLVSKYQTLKKADVTANKPLLEIDPSRTRFTDGYSELNIKTQRVNKNGTILFEGYPKDVEQGDLMPRPRLKSIVVKKEFIVRFPQGDWSERREKIKTIPRSKADLPTQMRETLIGRWYSREGQRAFIEKTITKMIPSGDEAIGDSMTTFNRGNVARPTIEAMKDQMKAVLEIMINKEREEQEDTKKK